MAKSKQQILKRMAQRHPLLFAVGVPAIFTESGHQIQKIEEGHKYDFQTSSNLCLGGYPDQIHENAFLSPDPIGLKRIYIEKIESIPKLTIKKIWYRILTRVGWEH